MDKNALLHGPKKDLKRCIIDLKRSHMDRNRPLIDLKSPHMDLKMLLMDVIRSHMELKRPLICMDPIKVSFGHKEDSYMDINRHLIDPKSPQMDLK